MHMDREREKEREREIEIERDPIGSASLELIHQHFMHLKN